MSKQESKLEKPLWLKTPLEEVEVLIEKLAKEGHTTEKIGLILRDQYGIPTTRVYGKKLGDLLRQKDLYKDANISNTEKKLEVIKQHLKNHSKDRKSKRVLEIRTARTRKLKLYASRKEKKAFL